MLSILVAFMFAILTDQFNATDQFVKVFISFFILFMIYLNLKDVYYEELYYSRIADYSTRSNEPYLETYRKIKNEPVWIKRFLTSYFGFGWKNWLPHLIGIIFLLSIIILLFV